MLFWLDIDNIIIMMHSHNTKHACMQEEYSSVLICYNRKTVRCTTDAIFINNAFNLKHSDVLSILGWGCTLKIIV